MVPDVTGQRRTFTRSLALGALALLSALGGCGGATQSANTNPTVSSAPASTLADDPTGFGDDPDLFVEGNLVFLAYHELGHAFISEFDLPVVGREEDAVDRLATWFFTPDDETEPADYLIAAMNSWFLSASEVPLAEIAWWDEHGTDEQRGYQIACLLYGSDPGRFASVADAVELPQARRDVCEDESAQNEDAWSRLLTPHLLADGEAAPEDSVDVIHGDTAAFSDERAYLSDNALLEELAEVIRTNYAFEPGIVVEAKECGEPNAFWNADDRALTVCYELVRDYRRLATGDAPSGS
jgi:hypothetical protein